MPSDLSGTEGAPFDPAVADSYAAKARSILHPTRYLTGNVEDRRINDPTVFGGPGRLLDPTPLTQYAGPQYFRSGGYTAEDLPIPGGPPPQMGREAGTDDLDRQLAFQDLLVKVGAVTPYWQQGK